MVKFREYTAAVLASAKFSLAQSSKAGSTGATRDVAASRMLLQSLIKSVSHILSMKDQAIHQMGWGIDAYF